MGYFVLSLKLKTNVWTLILQTVSGVIMIMFWIDVGASYVCQPMKLLTEEKVLCLYSPIQYLHVSFGP